MTTMTTQFLLGVFAPIESNDINVIHFSFSFLIYTVPFSLVEVLQFTLHQPLLNLYLLTAVHNIDGDTNTYSKIRWCLPFSRQQSPKTFPQPIPQVNKNIPSTRATTSTNTNLLLTQKNVKSTQAPLKHRYTSPQHLKTIPQHIHPPKHIQTILQHIQTLN